MPPRQVGHLQEVFRLCSRLIETRVIVKVRKKGRLPPTVCTGKDIDGRLRVRSEFKLVVVELAVEKGMGEVLMIFTASLESVF